jgi:hypothetical protein
MRHPSFSQYLWLLQAVALTNELTNGFITLQAPSFAGAGRVAQCHSQLSRLSPQLFANQVNAPPEWEEVLESDSLAEEDSSTSTAVSNDTPATTNTKNEFVALLQGQSLPIQIGSIALARKAWKKRRRSYSPILVPCSLLSIPHQSAVRNNIVYLVHKYGDNIQQSEDIARSALLGGGKGGGAGVVLSVRDLKKLYNHLLGGSLTQHAAALTGQNSIAVLLDEMMDTHTKIKYGVEVIGNDDTDENDILVVSSLPKRRAREWVSNVALAQVSTDLGEGKEDKVGVNQSTMKHTGMVRVRRQIPSKKNDEAKPRKRWSMEPLGAALRIAQQRSNGDNNSGTGETTKSSNSDNLEFMLEGETRFAHVLQYDGVGDGDGSPLLTLCLDPPKGALLEKKARRSTIQRQQEVRDEKIQLMDQGILSHAAPEHMLGDVSVGDGPFAARIVRVSSRSNSVFVDIGVGREKGKNAGGGMVQVLGMLRFDDIEANKNVLNLNRVALFEVIRRKGFVDGILSQILNIKSSLIQYLTLLY